MNIDNTNVIKFANIIGKSDIKLEVNENKEYILKLIFLSMNKTDLIGYVKKITKLEEISY